MAKESAMYQNVCKRNWKGTSVFDLVWILFHNNQNKIAMDNKKIFSYWTEALRSFTQHQ